jgi:hypothetical protein
MNCKDLEAFSNKKGQYWANAAISFIFSHGHGVCFWRELQDLHPELDEIEHLRCVNPKTKIFSTEGGQDVCTSPAEFLLEPWVLVQLPWNPVLLHQWLVAVFAEYLKLKIQFADFRHLGLPKTVSEYAAHMELILVHIQITMAEGFEALAGLINYSFSEKVAECVDNIKNSVVGNLVPFLELIFSGRLEVCINALKRICWNKKVLEYLLKKCIIMADKFFCFNERLENKRRQEEIAMSLTS